jgi:hypothetical protein
MTSVPSTREAIRERLAGRNRAVIDAAQWFAYGHLDKGAYSEDGAVMVSSPYDVSSQVADLAFEMIDMLPDSPELTHALRRLIEAKDCFVRAAIAAGGPQ